MVGPSDCLRRAPENVATSLRYVVVSNLTSVCSLLDHLEQCLAVLL